MELNYSDIVSALIVGGCAIIAAVITTNRRSSSSGRAARESPMAGRPQNEWLRFEQGKVYMHLKWRSLYIGVAALVASFGAAIYFELPFLLAVLISTAAVAFATIISQEPKFVLTSAAIFGLAWVVYLLLVQLRRLAA